MKKIIYTTLIITSLIGMFFFVRYEIMLYNTVIIIGQKTQLIENFLTTTQSDAVKEFNASLQK